MSERQAKRMKMQPEPPEPSLVPLSHYPFSAANVFSRMMEVHDSPMVIFNVHHTFALLLPPSSGSSTRHLRAVLVVKHPAATLIDLNVPPDALSAIMSDLQHLTKALHGATGCGGVKVSQSNGPIAGQTVPQLHFSLQACYSEADDTAGELEPGEVVARMRNLPFLRPPSLQCSQTRQGSGRKLWPLLLCLGS
jgi:diadenosine tetraphosphate (Ap4A) HIT family hydrolase